MVFILFRELSIANLAMLSWRPYGALLEAAEVFQVPLLQVTERPESRWVVPKNY